MQFAKDFLEFCDTNTAPNSIYSYELTDLILFVTGLSAKCLTIDNKFTKFVIA